MYVPSINTRATNIELTEDRRALIIRKLLPIGRVLDANEHAQIDLVMRRVRHKFGGSMYCLSVKLTTDRGSHIAIAIEPYLEKALSKARSVLRRSIVRGNRGNDYAFMRSRHGLGNRYSLVLKPLFKG